MTHHAYVRNPEERVDWVRSIPFLAVHLLPLLAFATGVTMFDLVLCAGLYTVRMFFITAGYHRYFSHRAYKTSRLMQFLLAFGGGAAAQKGALWWAAHHRHHHKYSDTPEDVHSPLKGFFWSHVGWILCRKYAATDYKAIKDFASYPELVFLNEHHWLPPTALGVACFLAGGWSALLVGFFLSTVLLYHGTFFINSLAHVFGRRRYATTDTSRNSFLLALVTLGEGWHNNHHYYQSTANQGFFWWEVDISYYILRALSWVGLVWDLRKPPQHVLDGNRIRNGEPDIGMFQARFADALAFLQNVPTSTRHVTAEVQQAAQARTRALQALRRHLQAFEELPADAIVRPQIAVTRHTFEKAIEQIENATPTPASRD